MLNSHVYEVHMTLSLIIQSRTAGQQKPYEEKNKLFAKFHRSIITVG